MESKEFEILLDLSLEEDLGAAGDVTAEAIFSNETCKAVLVSKDEGILAGTEYFKRVFEKLDPSCDVHFYHSDGSRLRKGDIVAAVEGRTKSVLSAERTAINFLAFLSGIATATRSYVDRAREHGKAVILDTRKTLAGYRKLSKYAVRVGGGKNHRMGLYDMVLIKDNHIDAAGSITAAVGRVRDRWKKEFTVEVECRTPEEVEEAVAAGADIVMLDNMDASTAARSVALGNGRVLFESSGDMNLERIADYAAAGVDYISVGRLTHSVRSFDYSLRISR